MSHFKVFDCNVSNIDYVKKAVQEMGYGIKENTVITDWAKQQRQVAVAVVDEKGKLMPLGWQVNNGKLDLYADWFMTPFSEKQFTQRVAQLHDKYKVLDTCEQNGWNVEADDIVTNDAGELVITASKWM